MQYSKEKFKEELNKVFDDNLHTKQWHNVADWIIIGLIVLSTVEIFLSTFDGVANRYGRELGWIDLFTQVFFTIEVTLRIWNADMLDPKYKGVVGRLRYCLSFYGLIDILATYTFYLSNVFMVPFTLLKTLRVVRLLRVFRYMHSFQLLSKAISSKKDELLVSLNFLAIVTLMMSFVLFFVEHEVQPEVYENGWSSVVWAFAQYIGDPGGFADMPPMTLCGKIIACLVGIMGIAIVAVPAGLVGSAFTDVMDKEKHETEVAENVEKIHLAFERKLDRPSGFQIVPPYLSVMEIQARMGMSEDDIVEAVVVNERFRMINLSTTQPAEMRPQDVLAVEHFALNTPYGICINRGSKVTIFTPSNIADPVMGWWGYYLAKIGGFNFISREIGQVRPYKSFYTYDKEHLVDHQQEFMSDLNGLVDSKDKWLFCVMPSSGSQEPEYPTQFHFGYGGKKGDESYDDPNITLNDIPLFDSLYKNCSKMLEEKYGFLSDGQRYHNTSNPKLFSRHLDHKVNCVYLRVAWSVICWDMRRIAIAKDLAETMNAVLDPDNRHELSPEMTIKDIAFDGYID